MNMAKIKHWHDCHEYLIWIVLAVIILRIPSLFEPYWSYNEGMIMLWLRFNLVWLKLIEMGISVVAVFVSGWLTARVLKDKRWMCLVALGVGLLASWLGKENLVTYHQNFYRYITRQISQADYYSSFDPEIMTKYEVARYLKTRTEAGDKIFIWGNEPNIYVLANRLSAGKYFTANQIVNLEKQKEVIDRLRKENPKYIVVMQEEKKKFDDLDSLISAEYAPVTKIEQALIFRRVK